MKIALILSHPSTDVSGSRREAAFCETLRQLGHDARIFRAAPIREVIKSQCRGVPVMFAPVDSLEGSPKRHVSTALLREIVRFRPRLMLFKGLGYAINSSLASALPKVPFGFIVGGAVNDKLLARASIVLGEYQEQLERHFPELMTRGRAFVLPKYLDPDLLQEPVPNPARDIDIVNVGCYDDPRKNQSALLEFTPLRKVEAAGWGNPQTSLIEAGIVHLGKLSQRDLFDKLWRSKVMVHPSLLDGLPRSVVEAMACGVPVVCLKETIYGGFAHGEHGFFAEPETLGHFANLILEDETLRSRMSHACRLYALSNHGLAAIDAATRSVAPILHSIARPSISQRLLRSLRKRINQIKLVSSPRWSG